MLAGCTPVNKKENLSPMALINRGKFEVKNKDYDAHRMIVDSVYGR